MKSRRLLVPAAGCGVAAGVEDVSLISLSPKG
jgi:hypothetical protein